MGSLPPLQLADAQHELLRLAFQHLLEPGTQVPPDLLSRSSGLPLDRVVGELDQLAAAGRIRRNGNGEVTGALGLTIDPTPHRLELNGTTRFTWCALDALGIMGALAASGRIRSASPHSGAPIEIGVTGGTFHTGDPARVLFLADYQDCGPVVDQWCPLVNFFESGAAATAWAASRSVTGECAPLPAAAENATQLWRSRLVPKQVIPVGDRRGRPVAPAQPAASSAFRDV